MTSVYPSQPSHPIHNHHKPHPPQNASQVDTNPKLYCVSIPRQVTFTETIIEVDEGVDNPFRPGDRLSKEAEIIVQLIKAGKPISPQSPTEEDIRTLEEWKKQQEILLHPEFDESQYIEDGQISPNGLSFNGNNNTTTKVNSPKANGNNNNNYKNNVKSPKGSPSKKKQNRKPSSPSSSPSTPSSPQSLGHHQASFDSQADSAFEKKKKVCCVIQ